MNNEKLRGVTFEGVTKMLLLGLERAPFVRTERHEDLLIETYFEAFTDARFTDAHAKNIALLFRNVRRTGKVWHTPKMIIAEYSRRISDRKEIEATKALPNLSDSDRAESLKRVARMVSQAFNKIEA